VTRPAAPRWVGQARPRPNDAHRNAPEPGRRPTGRFASRPILVALAWLVVFGLTAADAAPAVDAALAHAGPVERIAAAAPATSESDGSAAYDASPVQGALGHRAPRREVPFMTGPSSRERAAGPTVAGIASTYGPGWDGWIAWPSGPGWRLRVCGPGGCVVVVTTDAGPDLAMQRAGRVVDLDVPSFEVVAGGAWTIGLTRVTVTVLGRAPQVAART
jgi:hypothetical protein